MSVLSLDLTLLPGLIPIMGESENENLDLWLTNSLLHISVPIWGHIDQIPKKKKTKLCQEKATLLCCVITKTLRLNNFTWDSFDRKPIQW